MADIEDIRQRWAKATPGPWSVNLDPRNITAGPFYWKHSRPGAQWGGAEAEQATADAEAIAAAPSDIAALLADRAALREQLDRLIDWHKFQANSEGGIVQQIKDTLRCVEAGASPDKRPAGWTDQSLLGMEREKGAGDGVMVQLSSLLFEHAKVLEPCHPLSYRSAATVTADIRALVQGLVDELGLLRAADHHGIYSCCCAKHPHEYVIGKRDFCCRECMKVDCDALRKQVAKLEETNRNNVAIAGLECKELYESLRLSRERVAKLEALQTRNLAVLDQQRAAASAAVDVALAQQKRIAELEARLTTSQENARAEGNRAGRLAALREVQANMPDEFPEDWLRERIAEMEGGQADGDR